MPNIPAIKVENLTKRFGKLVAVDSVSFDVKEGELFGLLGPNGAGKTTIINMMSTLLNPSSGRALVAGFDISKDREAVRRSIGIVFQEPALDSQLTGGENLDFHAMMYGIGKEERKKRIREVLGLLELTPKADVLVDNYSGGMKRRLELARGLIHRPKVLFLDEPTLGLDAQTRSRIWDYIRELNRQHRVTIILTTHYMEEADYLCDRVAIIDYGRIVAFDTPERLKDVLGGDVVTLEVDGNTGALVKHLKNLKWLKTMKEHDGRLNLTMERGDRRIPLLVSIAQKNGIKITAVNLHKPSLQDVFLHFTGKSIREQEASQAEKNLERRRRMRRG